MKKTLATLVILSALAIQGCALSVDTVQPPRMGFYGHPTLVVIPGTYVYAMTDIQDEIFFHVGWWWRLWDGRWYTSRHYDRGWSHYRGVPGFYRQIDPDWREYYRHRRWHGSPWECERIPAPRVQQEWSRWQDNHYWEREKNWGVRDWRPAPDRQGGHGERKWDGSRFPQPDRQHPREGYRQQAASRQEGSPAREATRTWPPFVEKRRQDSREERSRDRYRERRAYVEGQSKDDSDSQSRVAAPDRESQERRPQRPPFVNQRRSDVEREARPDRQKHHRNRTFSDDGRRDSGKTAQQERDQSSERHGGQEGTPQFAPRLQEGAEERPQRQEPNDPAALFGGEQRDAGETGRQGRGQVSERHGGQEETPRFAPQLQERAEERPQRQEPNNPAAFVDDGQRDSGETVQQGRGQISERQEGLEGTPQFVPGLPEPSEVNQQLRERNHGNRKRPPQELPESSGDSGASTEGAPGVVMQ